METKKKCPICSQTLTEQKWGKDRFGKPYHAFRHEDPNAQCIDPATGQKYIEWIKATPAKQRMAQEESRQYESLMAANRKLYSLILAVAHLQGFTPRDIQDELTKIQEQNEKNHD